MKKFGLLFLLCILAACAGDKAADSEKSSKDETPKIKEEDLTKDLICPQVAILKAGEEIVDYGGEKPDADQLVAKAHMTSLKGDCGYRKDGIDISFNLHMFARKGPRLGGAQVSFPYFIAIVDPSENIISRQIITASFHFPGLDKTVSYDEPLHVFIPVSTAMLQAGPAYRVFVGFQQPSIK